MALEVELKYGADDDAPLRALATAAGLGPAALGPAATVDELDRYLDTADGRLAAVRWACRLRRRGGRTRVSLKGPPEPGTGQALHRRPELEGPATDELEPSAWPASEARERLDRLREGRPVHERFALHQERTERAVLLDGRRIGTLTLDRVRVEAGGRDRGTLHAVELELGDAAAPADESLLGGLDVALRAIDGLRPDDRTKLEHALDRLGEQ